MVRCHGEPKCDVRDSRVAAKNVVVREPEGGHLLAEGAASCGKSTDLEASGGPR